MQNEGGEKGKKYTVGGRIRYTSLAIADSTMLAPGALLFTLSLLFLNSSGLGEKGWRLHFLVYQHSLLCNRQAPKDLRTNLTRLMCPPEPKLYGMVAQQVVLQ